MYHVRVCEYGNHAVESMFEGLDEAQNYCKELLRSTQGEARATVTQDDPWNRPVLAFRRDKGGRARRMRNPNEAWETLGLGKLQFT